MSTPDVEKVQACSATSIGSGGDTFACIWAEHGEEREHNFGIEHRVYGRHLAEHHDAEWLASGDSFAPCPDREHEARPGERRHGSSLAEASGPPGSDCPRERDAQDRRPRRRAGRLAGGALVTKQRHRLVCGLNLSAASEWCFGTHDGDHRPSLPSEKENQ